MKYRVDCQCPEENLPGINSEFATIQGALVFAESLLREQRYLDCPTPVAVTITQTPG